MQGAGPGSNLRSKYVRSSLPSLFPCNGKRQTMRRTILTTLALASLAATLSGCVTANDGNFQAAPVGVGSGPDRLKRTPCACVQLPNRGDLPAHLRDLPPVKA